jgi:hypothetical protein
MDIKIVIIAILLVLSITAAGWGWTVQLGKNEIQNQVIILGNEKIALDKKITTLEKENASLKNKIDKGAIYAKALDSLLEPARKASGLATKPQYSEANWFLEFTEATKTTTDSKLENSLRNIMSGGDAGSQASMEYMDRAVTLIIDELE